MILIATLQGVIDPKPYQENQKQRDCRYKQLPIPAPSTMLSSSRPVESGILLIAIIRQ